MDKYYSEFMYDYLISIHGLVAILSLLLPLIGIPIAILFWLPIRTVVRQQKGEKEDGYAVIVNIFVEILLIIFAITLIPDSIKDFGYNRDWWYAPALMGFLVLLIISQIYMIVKRIKFNKKNSQILKKESQFDNEQQTYTNKVFWNLVCMNGLPIVIFITVFPLCGFIGCGGLAIHYLLFASFFIFNIAILILQRIFFHKLGYLLIISSIFGIINAIRYAHFSEGSFYSPWSICTYYGLLINAAILWDLFRKKSNNEIPAISNGN